MAAERGRLCAAARSNTAPCLPGLQRPTTNALTLLCGVHAVDKWALQVAKDKDAKPSTPGVAVGGGKGGQVSGVPADVVHAVRARGRGGGGGRGRGRGQRGGRQNVAADVAARVDAFHQGGPGRDAQDLEDIDDDDDEKEGEGEEDTQNEEDPKIVSRRMTKTAFNKLRRHMDKAEKVDNSIWNGVDVTDRRKKVRAQTPKHPLLPLPNHTSACTSIMRALPLLYPAGCPRWLARGHERGRRNI